MGFKIKGADLSNLKFRLETTRRKVHENTNIEMRALAFSIQQTARNMAPIQYSPLRNSIKIQRTAVGQKGQRGFKQGFSAYNIYIDMSTPAPFRAGGVVAGYAYMIHEHMGYGNVKGAIMPSLRSIEAGNGEIVGGKFMVRAMLKHQQTTKLRLLKAVIKSFQ